MNRILLRLISLSVLAPVYAIFASEPETPGLGAATSQAFAKGDAEAAARYASKDWRPGWSDEFSVEGLPDATRWSYEHGLIRNKEAQFYTAKRLENAAVVSGVLRLRAIKELWQGATCTSASLVSSVPFHYGKIEVRAKIPTGRGTWPAIWLLGDTTKDGWPRCGEIDMMENVGFDPSKLHFTIHTEAFNHVIGTQKSRAVELETPWAEFHVYGLLWSKDRLEFFLDGEKVFEFANDGKGNAHWPFDKPEWLKLNLSIGGSWGGSKGIDDTIFPSDFEIDYVRVYTAAP